MLQDSPLAEEAVHGLRYVGRVHGVVVRVADVVARFNEPQKAKQGQRLNAEGAQQIVS